MASVTQRIREIKQPRGGYLNPSEFVKIQLEDNEILKEENIHSCLVGLAIDYLTRFMSGVSKEKAFKVSLLGATLSGEEIKADKLLRLIKGLDNISIYNACKLVGYDVRFRTGQFDSDKIDEIDPDVDTINNIRIMVKRSISFFDTYGPIVKDGFTFEGGYTDTITAGDGDFLTEDTLWDFKVSKNNLSSSNTLQLLVYYIMGIHSIYNEFNSIKKLGVFNPRLNCVYLKIVSDISKDVIEDVSINVIGYTKVKDNLIKNDDMLSIIEIMKFLRCSRYMVMKYYTEKNLPLIKVNNKYYINKIDLFNWVNEMEEERKFNCFVSILVAILLCIILLIYLFSLR